MRGGEFLPSLNNMNKYITQIFIGIIILSGTFCSGFAYDQFDFKNENGRFYVAQLSFFILSIGCLGSLLIYRYNKWVSYLGIALSFGVFKTFLLANAPKVNMFESTIIGLCAFIAYYAIRNFRLKEDILKWFIIPAAFNIIVVLIQYFDHYPLFFLYVKGVSGLIGNEGMSAAYLALTLPIFFKYFRWGILPCAVAIVVCGGSVGIVAGVIGLLFYLYKTDRKRFMFYSAAMAVILLLLVCVPKSQSVKEELHLRAAMVVGTLDGIKHNPVLGWGVGSFIPVVSQIPPEESEFLGIKLNTQAAIMNHPHNELLSGWWKIGIAFPIIIMVMLVKFLRSCKIEAITSFAVVLVGIVISMGWFFTLPSFFLLITAFAVYENTIEEDTDDS